VNKRNQRHNWYPQSRRRRADRRSFSPFSGSHPILASLAAYQPNHPPTHHPISLAPVIMIPHPIGQRGDRMGEDAEPSPVDACARASYLPESPPLPSPLSSARRSGNTNLNDIVRLLVRQRGRTPASERARRGAHTTSGQGCHVLAPAIPPTNMRARESLSSHPPRRSGKGEAETMVHQAFVSWRLVPFPFLPPLSV